LIENSFLLPELEILLTIPKINKNEMVYEDIKKRSLIMKSSLGKIFKFLETINWIEKLIIGNPINAEILSLIIWKIRSNQIHFAITPKEMIHYIIEGLI